MSRCTTIIFIILFIFNGALFAQSKRVLFLGNSYYVFSKEFFFLITDAGIQPGVQWC